MLRDGGRVADIGCGDGWSSIGIARAYPAVTVDGYDVDADSVEAARGHAAAEGMGDRVRFTLVDAASVPTSGDYDLVAAFECIHDLPDPVGVLRSARRMVKPGGTVLVMDERVPEAFTGPGDSVEQLMYGISMLVCLPDGLSHLGSVGTGTVMRPDTLRTLRPRSGLRRHRGAADRARHVLLLPTARLSQTCKAPTATPRSGAATIFTNRTAQPGTRQYQ